MHNKTCFDGSKSRVARLSAGWEKNQYHIDDIELKSIHDASLLVALLIEHAYQVGHLCIANCDTITLILSPC